MSDGLNNGMQNFKYKRVGKKFKPKENTYGSDWKRIRNAYIAANPLCVHCLADNHVTAAQQVDHIIPKMAGGTDDESNLQSLCEPCHRKKTKQDMKDYRY